MIRSMGVAFSCAVLTESQRRTRASSLATFRAGPLARSSLHLSVVPGLSPIQRFAWVDDALGQPPACHAHTRHLSLRSGSGSRGLSVTPLWMRDQPYRLHRPASGALLLDALPGIVESCVGVDAFAVTGGAVDLTNR